MRTGAFCVPGGAGRRDCPGCGVTPGRIFSTPAEEGAGAGAAGAGTVSGPGHPGTRAPGYGCTVRAGPNECPVCPVALWFRRGRGHGPGRVPKARKRAATGW